LAQIDKEKEFIGFLKAIFLTFIAIDSSMIAWLFNHPKLNIYSIIVLIGIFSFSVTIIILFKLILKKIDELKEM
jgi:CHASE2 domain-containing sensor protein